MNLRIATLWITGCLLLATFLFVSLSSFLHGIRWGGIISITECIWIAMLLWLFYGSPLAIAFFMSDHFQSKTSQAILLISSISYGMWFVCVFIGTFYFQPSDTLSGLIVFVIGITSLPVMIPLWISACISEAYFNKNSAEFYEEWKKKRKKAKEEKEERERNRKIEVKRDEERKNAKKKRDEYDDLLDTVSKPSESTTSTDDWLSKRKKNER